MLSYDDTKWTQSATAACRFQSHFQSISVCLWCHSHTWESWVSRLIFGLVILSAAECDRVGLFSSSFNIWEQDAQLYESLLSPIHPVFSPTFFVLLSAMCPLCLSHCSAPPLAANCSSLIWFTYESPTNKAQDIDSGHEFYFYEVIILGFLLKL